jgi:hypothetical protein
LLGRRIRLVVVMLGLGKVTVDGVPEVWRDSGSSCPRGLILGKLERESSLDRGGWGSRTMIAVGAGVGWQ